MNCGMQDETGYVDPEDGWARMDHVALSNNRIHRHFKIEAVLLLQKY